MNDKLTATNPISHFSEKQIKMATSIFDGYSPLSNLIAMIDAIGCYILFNENIEKPIRDGYYAMEMALRFNLDLIKSASGYND